MSSSTNFVNPTYYNLQKATLRSEFSPGLVELNITGLIPSITINSSTSSETMYGSVRIVDSTGLLDDTPLRGEEQIILEIADSKTINENGGITDGQVSEPYRFVGFVYKVDNVTAKDTNDAVFYDMHFVSYQSFNAGTYRITRPFRDVKVSDIAKTIFDDYFKDQFIEPGNAKELILEETEGTIRCIIPKMRPEEAMNFLSKRSYSSSSSKSCTFRFFESSKGYHFVTDEELFRLSEQDETRSFKFTFLDAIPNTLDNFDVQLNNLETLENSRRVNSLDDIYNGAYRNKVIELDILSRTTNLFDESSQYNYFDQEYFELRPNQSITDRHTRAFISAAHKSAESSGRDEDVQKTFIVIKDYTDGEESNSDLALSAQTYYKDIIMNRLAYSKHIESITVNAVGPGRLDITAGDIVDLDVKDFKLASNEQSGVFVPNKRLSGKYIIRSVSHIMEHETMKNSYVLVKKDWASISSAIGFDIDVDGPQ